MRIRWKSLESYYYSFELGWQLSLAYNLSNMVVAAKVMYRIAMGHYLLSHERQLELC
jgi:hypothetical protein